MSEGMEEWVSCADWLERCGMLTEEQNSTLESVEHLASILKDGVILCNLLNKLKPNSVPYKSYSIKPQGSLFLYGKNIRAFLAHCKSAFKMKDSQLFDVTDLLDLQNFGKVIYTLSNLSKTRDAKNQNIEPFTAEEDTDYIIMEKVMDEVENDYNSSVYDTRAFDNDNSEEIYDVLVGSKNESEQTCKSPRSKKEMCMDELVSTEKNFLKVLDNIIEHFMKKLKDRLTPDEYSTIFCSITDIKKVHSDFYAKLKAALGSSQPAVEIAKCFLSSYTSMLFYGEFSSQMTAANQELERVCQTNNAVAEIVRKGADIANVKLHDLLTVPVQRILKYHLIIRELTKHCQGNETTELKKALDVMEDLNLYINEVKRDNENISTIVEIQKSIVDLDKYLDGNITSLDSYGRRHFDGEFDIKKLFTPNGKSTQKTFTFPKGYIFLFDKLIILCTIKRKGEQYTYSASLAIRSVDVNAGSNERGMNQLILSKRDDAKDEKFIVSCKKTENILKLYNYIMLAKDNCCPEAANINGHNFLLTNFREACFCSICKKLLRGKISQGYRCQKTDKIAHKECLSKIAVVAPRRRTQPPFPPKQTASSSNREPSVTGRPERRPPPRRIPSKGKSNQLESEPWFSGTKTRSGANSILESLPDGTFLVRYNEEKNNYIISMKYENVRHLIIFQTPSGDFFLNNDIKFPDIQSLIGHFKKNSLQSVYSSIYSTLGNSYSEAKKKQTRCRALYDFSPLAAGQLAFSVGDEIEVLSTKDDPWWRGRLQNNTKGNFPSNYVEVIQN